MATRKRPGLLTLICILAILLGVAGLWNAWRGSASSRMVSAWVAEEGQSQQMLQLRRETLRETRAVTDRWKHLSTSLSILHFAVAVCLIYGGVLAFRLRPVGRTVLVGTFVCGIAYELVSTVFLVATLVVLSDVNIRYIVRSGELQGRFGNMAPESERAMMTTSYYVGLAFVVAWMLLKITFYVVATICLRKPAVRTLYANHKRMAE